MLFWNRFGTTTSARLASCFHTRRHTSTKALILDFRKLDLHYSKSDEGDYFLITLPVFGRARNQTAHSLGDDPTTTTKNSNKKIGLWKLLLAIIINFWWRRMSVSQLYIYFFYYKAEVICCRDIALTLPRHATTTLFSALETGNFKYLFENLTLQFRRCCLFFCLLNSLLTSFALQRVWHSRW